MNEKLAQNIQKFDDLPVRTRLIMTLAVVAVLYLVFEMTWFDGQRQELKKLDNAIKTQDNEIAQLIERQQLLNAGVLNSRNDPKQQQLEAVEDQLEEIQDQLAAKALTLVQPEEMAPLLQEIIANSKKLKLIALVKQTPQPMFEENAEVAEDQQAQMYQHAVQLKFEGSYANTQAFLERLEQMEKKVNFDSLEFSVEAYPKSTVTLVVSTYSLTRKWIGG